MPPNKDHAIFAPSSWARLAACAASALLTRDLPDEENEYAREGTAGHEYAAKWLLSGYPSILPFTAQNGFIFDNDPNSSGDIIESIHHYVKEIRVASEGQSLFIEQALPIERFTLEKGAEGTGDAIIVHKDGKTIQIRDLKLGMGIKVFPKRNKQLMLYALGAMDLFSTLGNFDTFILGIHQPRLNHTDEWECSRSELENFGEDVKFRAQFLWRLLAGEPGLFDERQDFNPGEEQCRWCKAKAICPAIAKHSLAVVANDFTDLDQNPTAALNRALQKLNTIDNEKLSWYMQNLGVIEDWMKAVRQKVEGELFAGHDVPGWKLVQGKKGNRKFADENAVEKRRKKLKMKRHILYVESLISPVALETLDKKSKGLYAAFADLITQSDGKPSVAPSTDPRPALQIGAVEDDFEVIENKA